MRGPSSRDANAPPNKKQRVSPSRERAAAAGEALDLSAIGRDFVPVLEDNSDDEAGDNADANVSRQPGPGGGISAAMSATGDAAGEDSSSRYYGERSLESLEQAIRANKHNVAGWLNYAFVVPLLSLSLSLVSCVVCRVSLQSTWTCTCGGTSRTPSPHSLRPSSAASASSASHEHSTYVAFLFLKSKSKPKRISKFISTTNAKLKPMDRSTDVQGRGVGAARVRQPRARL